MIKELKAKYSLNILLSTIVLTMVLGYALYYTVNKIQHTSNLSWQIVFICIALFIVTTLLYAFLSQIRKVCITSKNVVIHKMLGTITIDRNEIISLKHKRNLRYDIRVFAISGLFGHIGLFWNKQVGRYVAYVINEKQMVEIKTSKKTYVISCEDYSTLEALSL